MNKQTLLAEIRATHEALAVAVGTLGDDAWAEPLPDMNGWTRKDALAHVGWWSDHSVRVVTALRAGGVPYEQDPTSTSTPRTDRSSRSSAIETWAR